MEKEKCDSLVQLGDFAYPNAAHKSYPEKFNAAHDVTVHVIGNHEFDHGLTRKDCYKTWGISSSYYRKDIGGLRVLVLDGNESGSPNHQGGYPSYLGRQQLNWLKKELQESKKPVLVLSHQPLAGRIAVDNAKTVQKMLAEFSSKIILCVNGHSHIDSLLQIDGVSYLHINSASYYWVGGKERMLYYADPLFTTLTFDPETSSVIVAAKASQWKGGSPKEIGYFDRKNSPPEKAVTPQIRARSLATKKSVLPNRDG